MLALTLTSESVGVVRHGLDEVQKALAFVDAVLHLSSSEYGAFVERRIRGLKKFEVLCTCGSWAADVLEFVETTLSAHARTLRCSEEVRHVNDEVLSRWRRHCAGHFRSDLATELRPRLDDWKRLHLTLEALAREADDTGGYSDYSAYSDDESDSQTHDSSDDDDGS